MALQKALTFKGVNLPNAYHRITQLAISRDRNDVAITLRSYQDQAAAASLGDPLQQQMYFLPYDSGITVSGAYAHLKTLPEFEGAADV